MITSNRSTAAAATGGMKPRRKLLWVLASVGVAIGAGACSGDDQGAGSDPADPPAETTEATTDSTDESTITAPPTSAPTRDGCNVSGTISSGATAIDLATATVDGGLNHQGVAFYTIDAGQFALSLGYSSGAGDDPTIQAETADDLWFGTPSLGGTWDVASDGSAAVIRASLRNEIGTTPLDVDLTFTC